MNELSGKISSRYKILEKLGEGGMGEVYKALDTKLNRTVALKFLPADMTRSADAVARFTQEAQTASALDHANICTIYDIDKTPEGLFFIAMAYYEGVTLLQKLNEGPLSPEAAIDVIIQMGEGLARAHEVGIVHRDIKPENAIITGRGEVKLIDFGIAKLAGQSSTTQAGHIVGTLAYISPEQLQGGEVDHRTDIWSLGVTLYQMLTGQLPFPGEYDHAIMYSIVHTEPEPLQHFSAELSPHLQRVIDRALEKDPVNRYQSIREMLADLDEPDAGEVVVAQTGPETPAAPKNNYLPEYKNDIYVSYSNVDNTPLNEGQKGWITRFHQSLEIRLEQLLGAETRILRGAEDSAESGAPVTIDDTALMVSVVSPQYVKSGTCTREVRNFYDSAERKGQSWIQNHSRIFKAVKTFVPREKQPKELQNAAEYEFFQFDPGTGRPREFWPELGAEANRNFWMKLEDIAYDIYQVMENLRNHPEGTPPDHTLSPNRPAVYLAETTFDLKSQHERIKRQLLERGFVVLPDKPLPLNAGDLHSRITADLQFCNYAVHLIGENYGIIPEGGTHSINEIQHQLSLEHSRINGFSRLIWMPPELHSKDERQQSFIQALKTDPGAQKNADLLQTSLEEFKTFLLDKLNEEPHITSSAALADQIIRIYLQCDPGDLDTTAPLEEFLFDQGYEVILPAFEGDELEVFEAHKQNLLICDATIVFYGTATDTWLSTKLADLQKIAGYGRKTPMKAKAVFIAGPETRRKQRFRSREMLILKNFEQFTPGSLAPFLQALGSEGRA